MRVALVYDRLNKIGGAEQILQAFHSLYPQAPWYTSFWNPARAPFTKTWDIRTPALGRWPWVRSHHELFPWLTPFIFESFDFSAYDLVISIGSAECKGIITKPGTFHLHYCLTPTRYLYSHASEYLSNPLYRAVAKYLRLWDQVAATRPDNMIAISTPVKNRIQKYYHRDSDIIFPPVNTKKFAPSDKLTNRQADLPKDYFLVVSRLVPYKRLDILIRAANQSRSELIVIGEGSEKSRLAKLAGPTVHLFGHVSDQELPGYYHHCTAYLQANIEDFGISMVEAQAAGKPVIAYGAGGAKDILIPNKTGILLTSCSVASFAKAMEQFGTMSFVPTECIQNAQRFDTSHWRRIMRERIANLWTSKNRN